MEFWERKTTCEQLDNKLSDIKEKSSLAIPGNGWIKTIREALGMSTTQLAKKVGIHQSRISRLENAEKSGNLKLSSLQKIADGLGLTFVYGFIPKESFKSMLVEQAEKIAQKRLDRLIRTMSLENQSLSKEQLKKALEDSVNKVLIDPPKDFWEDVDG